MPSLFISHSGRDNEITKEIRKRIADKGYEDLFLDFDPEHGIPAGRDWEQAIYGNLKSCDGVIFLMSNASVNSNWCHTEVAMARSIGKPIFPIIIADNAHHPLLDPVHYINLQEEGERAYERLWKGLRDAGLDPRDVFAWDSERPPYPGLDPFDIKDAAIFFGRSKEIEQLLELFRSPLNQETSRLVALVGPSGSGKSSLVRAGLLPRLKKLADRWLLIPPIRPRSRPFSALARSLARSFHHFGQESSWDQLDRRLRQGPDEATVILNELLIKAEIEPNSVLLTIDQFEEILTLTADEERGEFLSMLRELLRQDDIRTWTILTLRSEFITRALQQSALLELEPKTMLLGPVDRARLPTVIVDPGKRAGLEFEPRLVGQMVEDTVGGDALPLLSYTLQQLYEQTQKNDRRQVTIGDYERIGRVQGALKSQADGVFEELTDKYGEEFILNTLLKLITVDIADEPVRRSIPRNQLQDTENECLQSFIEARLLKSYSPEANDEEPLVEIAHEALIREWPVLQNWIEQNREGLRLHRRLSAATLEWLEHDKDSAYLYRGARLTNVEEWLFGSENVQRDDQGWSVVRTRNLTKEEQDFVEASIEMRQKEEARRQRELKRLRLFVAIFFVLFILAIIALIFARIQQNNAKESESKAIAESTKAAIEAENAYSRLLEVTSLTWVNYASRAYERFNSDLARQFVLKANDNEKPPTQAIEALAEFGYGPGTVRLFEHNPDSEDNSKWIWDAAISHDGKLAISGGYDANILLWGVATGTRRVLKGHNDIIRSVSFFPDDATALSAGCAGRAGDCTTSELIIWDIDTGQPLHRLEGEFGEVLSTAISRNGDIVAGTADGELVLWNSQFERIPIENSAHDGPINSVTFNPAGSLFLSAGCGERFGEICFKGRANLWSMTDKPSILLSFEDEGLRDEILAATFSQNGHFIVTGVRDSTVRVWDLDSGDLLSILPGHNDWVRDVAVHPNGRWIVSVGCGQKDGDKCVKGVVFIWDILEQHLLFELVGHTDEVQSVLFVPENEHQILTASRDSTLRLWDISRGGIDRLYSGHADTHAVAFGNEGQIIAEGCLSITPVGSCESDPYTLFGSSGNPISAYTLDTENVVSIAISADATHLLTGSRNGKVTLWEMKDKTFKIIDTVEYDHKISSVSFASESNDSIVIGSYDNNESVVLLDLAGDQDRIYKGMNAAVLSIAVNPNGDRIVAGGGSPENDLIEWDRDTERIVGRYCGGHAEWDASGERCAQQSNELPYNGGHTNWVTAVTYSPDGKYLLSGGHDGAVILWNTSDYSVEKYLLDFKDEYMDWITSLTFSSDGNLALSASVDGTIIIWETENWQKIHEFWDPSATLSSVDYSIEQDLVVAGTNSSRVYLYRLKHEDQLNWIREHRLIRDITDDERNEFNIEK